MAKRLSPKRGDVFLVNFDPTIGSEIQKTRPALIIQNNTANEHSPITIVAAITSKFDNELYPTEVEISANKAGLKQNSVILLNQIRSIDGQRLVKKLGEIDELTLKKVNSAIKISLALIDI